MSAVAVAGTLVVGAAGGAQATTTTGVPIGNVDGVTAVAGGIKVRGWAWDPDTSAPVTVSIKAGGTVKTVTATLSRPDVARVVPAAGSARGFDAVINVPAGTHQVCVTAVNVGAGVDRAFTCATATVAGTAPVVSTPPVVVSTAPVVVSTAPVTATAVRAGAGNTGVPAGLTLTPSGPLRITQPGAVIDGLDVKGCVVVAADNVTIRNTRIRCTDSPKNRAVIMEGARANLLIEDTEIDGGGITEIGVDLANVTMRRLNIHHVNDGIRMGSNITVLDSWIHHMTRRGTLHPDGIQGVSAQNIVIRGNTIDPRNPDTGDFANAAIMLGSETGTKLSRNVVIENNHLHGGGFAINISGAINAQDFKIRANRFGRDSRWGTILTPARVGITAAHANVFDNNDAPIKIQLTV